MSATPLDIAHGAMVAAPDDDAARLRFFERLADSELFLMLDDATHNNPRLFETSEGTFVLAFDSEDRLSAFAGAPSEYAALSGRSVAAMLADQGVGIALNPDVAPSSMLIPAEAMDWLTSLLADAPKEVTALPRAFRTPTAPPRLIEGLDAKLASAAGLASHAFLADVTYDDGRTALFLAICDPASGAEAALAKAVSEALIFSGLEKRALDVAFLTANDEIADTLRSLAVRIDLPQPEKPEGWAPKAPGMTPDLPPKLR